MREIEIILPFLSIFLPVLAAAVSALVSARHAERLTYLASASSAAMSALLLFMLLIGEDEFIRTVGIVPWGGVLCAGPIEAMLAAAMCTVTLLSVLGNSKFTRDDVSGERLPSYYAVLNLMTASLMAMVYADDIFTLYVFIETAAISLCCLVLAKNDDAAVRASLRCLLIGLAGSGLMLVSICLLYKMTGRLMLNEMRAAVSAIVAAGHHTRPLLVAMNLMIMGLAVKGALYPFALWLPDAHGSSVNVSSALISGVVIKGHIIAAIKILFRVFGADVVRSVGMDTELLIFAVLAMICGSLHALHQTNMKRMIAWSSVAQVGYIFLGIGLSTAAGLASACLHMMVHIAVKPMIVTAAGGLIDVSDHSKELRALRGSFYRNRWAGLGLIIGACSMIGVPMFAGFASKLGLTMAALTVESPAAIAALAALSVSTVLNALYYVPTMIVVLMPSEEFGGLGNDSRSASRPTVVYAAVMLIFLSLNFYLGLFYAPVVDVLQRGAELLMS